MAQPNFLSSEADEFFFTEENVLQDKLEAGDCSLEEVLDEENFITLLAERDYSLISFLQERENISQLISYVSQFPDEINNTNIKQNKNNNKDNEQDNDNAQDNDGVKTEDITLTETTINDETTDLNDNSIEIEKQKRTFKYPYMACEVLSCDIAEVQNIILGELFSYQLS